MTFLDTEKLSLKFREKAINLDRKTILTTNFKGTDQEKDFTEPANCNGFGRIRHFKLNAGKDWIQNPLPILPAAKALSVSPEAELRTQVFQTAVCNWQCWYCFVDDKLLRGSLRYSSFLSCEEMLEMYLNQENPPQVIDLTGGQPELTPERVPWMMQAIMDRGLEEKIYLWSDDNLSNDYFWKYLTPIQIDLITSYRMYSRVCCLKGIDAQSFSSNTNAEPKHFETQLDIAKRLLDLNIDIYFYVTLTANTDTNFELVIPKFFDKLQKLHELLPLRIVPLKIFEFSPLKKRLNNSHLNLLSGQYIALEFWKRELSKRFSEEMLTFPITEINLNKV